MTGFWQTMIGAVIGAVAAIAGGLIGAWWQADHAHEVARRIRREERREEGLYALNVKVVDIVERIERAYRAGENDPDAWQTAWDVIYGAVEELRTAWEAELSGRIPDPSIGEKYREVRVQEYDCAGRLGTPGEQRIITATGKDFVRDAGRLKMLLDVLGKEIRNKVEELLAEPS